MIHVPGRPSRSRPRKHLAAELNLTALVDVLTILVVFCLLNFQVSGELLT